MACQVRVMTCGQTPFVTVLNTVSLTLVPLQMSVAVGVSKLQGRPQSTILLVAQQLSNEVIETLSRNG